MSEKIKILDEELKGAQGCAKQMNNVNNKKSALKARIKKTNEKDYMRLFNKLQEDKFKELNALLPAELALDIFDTVKEEEKEDNSDMGSIE